MRFKSISIAAITFILSTTTYASPVTITVTGTIDMAIGSLSDTLGDNYTASFLFDFDENAASSVDTDDTNNPLETFSSIYSFHDGNYGWSASLSSGGSASSDVISVLTADNIVESGFNNDQAFDLIDIWGSSVTPYCPQEILDTKGFCDETDYNPGSGIEIGLSMGKSIDWFSGNDLPTYIPELNQLLGAGLWGLEFSDGIETGEFSATVDTMTVSSAAISSVPVPAAVWLFGSGLLGLTGIARRKKA